jgi:hypothetical protein
VACGGTQQGRLRSDSFITERSKLHFIGRARHSQPPSWERRRTNTMHLVLFGLRNRTFGSYLAAKNRILISVMRVLGVRRWPAGEPRRRAVQVMGRPEGAGLKLQPRLTRVAAACRWVQDHQDHRKRQAQAPGSARAGSGCTHERQSCRCTAASPALRAAGSARLSSTAGCSTWACLTMRRMRQERTTAPHSGECQTVWFGQLRARTGSAVPPVRCSINGLRC